MRVIPAKINTFKVNLNFNSKGDSQVKVSDDIRILSGRSSGKLPGKPGIIREKLLGDLV